MSAELSVPADFENDSARAENRLIIISLSGMIKFFCKKPVSDTLIPTPDGALVVDTEKLMKKENVRRMMQDIRSKTRVAPPKADKEKAVVPA